MPASSRSPAGSTIRQQPRQPAHQRCPAGRCPPAGSDGIIMGTRPSRRGDSKGDRGGPITDALRISVARRDSHHPDSAPHNQRFLRCPRALSRASVYPEGRQQRIWPTPLSARRQACWPSGRQQLLRGRGVTWYRWARRTMRLSRCCSATTAPSPSHPPATLVAQSRRPSPTAHSGDIENTDTCRRRGRRACIEKPPAQRIRRAATGAPSREVISKQLELRPPSCKCPCADALQPLSDLSLPIDIHPPGPDGDSLLASTGAASPLDPFSAASG